MNNIVDTIQKIVQHELEKIRIGELGVVTSVFPHSDKGDKDNYECNVKLKNSGLELRKVPVATGHIGTVAIPNVGDLVLLSFIKGDVNQAVIIGRLYNDEDRPPVNNPNEVIHRLPLHAEDDKAIKLEIRNLQDKEPPRELLLEMLNDIKVQIVDTKVYLQAGKTKLTMSCKDEEVLVEAGKSKLTIKQDGDVVVESEANINITSKTDTTIKCINCKIDASGNIDLGQGGTGVVTVASHKCFFTGAPHVGSATVKAKM